MSDPVPEPTAGSRGSAQVSRYVRLERWEIPPSSDTGGLSAIGGRVPVDEHLRGEGGGLITGALLTGIDSLAGLACGLAVLPEWIVTTKVAARVLRLDHRGPLRLHGRVLRRGRTAVRCAVDVVDEGDGDLPVASAMVTCSILDPGAMPLAFTRPVVTPMPPADTGALPPDVFFGIEPGTGPTTRLQLAERLRNHWGILHGGVVAYLVDVAAARTVRGMRSGSVASADTVLHYLNPGRVGPIEARCRIVGSRGSGTVVRVAVHDLGLDDRMVALASVTVREV